jgi:chromate transporter
VHLGRDRRPGWTQHQALGAAQALPGPLSTFAAYLCAVVRGPWGGLGGGAVALVAVFLPGFLLLMGVLPFRGALRAGAGAQAAMRGVCLVSDWARLAVLAKRC